MSKQSAPAGKPRKRDPERRQRELLEAAAEIVVAQGSAALTHRAAADRAGVALGSATRYFPSIGELREATLRLLATESEDTLDRIESELAAADDKLAACTDLVYEFLLDTRQVHASLAMLSAATTDPELRTVALSWNERLVDILSEYVDHDRAVTAQLYVDGVTIHAALHDEPLPREVVHGALATILDSSVNAHRNEGDQS